MPLGEAFFLLENVLFDGVGWGGVGWGGVGWDGNQKGPLISVILRYIIHFTYLHLYIYIKNVLANFLWV